MKQRNTENDLRRFLGTLLVVSVVREPMNILATILGIRSPWIALVLTFLVAFDLVFVARFFWQAQIHRREVVLLGLLAFSLPIGLLNFPDISRRHLTDFVIPLLFLLKCAVWRGLLSRSDSVRLLAAFMPKYAVLNAASGVVAIGMFLVFSRSQEIYLGLTPDLYPLVCMSALAKGPAPVIGAIALVLFTGKRSLLVGALAITLVAKFRQLRELLRFAILAPVVALGVGVFLWQANFENSAAFQKYRFTFVTVQENLDNSEAIESVGDYITGGRISEVRGTLEAMRPADYLIGKGVGFTYYFAYLDDPNHGNAHFTPVTIISKYGFPFYAILMAHVISTVVRGSKKSAPESTWLVAFFTLYICVINIDFMFAYSFFVNPLFPIGMGLLGRSPTPPPQNRSDPPEVPGP